MQRDNPRTSRALTSSRSRPILHPLGLPAAGSLLLALALLACSPEPEAPDPPPAIPTEPSATEIARAADPRPSIVLVVLDTMRVDAVSAYGAVQGTTPTVDALASRGTRFTHAFAPSPWTVSSHASLFSGLRVDEHGVGLGGVVRADDTLAMLAEDLRDAGYVTAGFAENSLLSPELGFDQGFDHFEVSDALDVVQAEREGDSSMAFFSLARKVRDWNRQRDRARPYFLFVNIMDAHDPYSVRPENPWVPPGTATAELESVAHHYKVSTALCRNAPTRHDQALLRGLYLGDVRAADAKLARVLDAIGRSDADEARITVVTSDQREHLGEHRLSGHRFSVRTPALHIPLVVTGVNSLEAPVIDHPVELRSLRSSLLCWALGAGCPAALTIDPGAGPETDPIYAIWSDRSAEIPGVVLDQLGIPRDRAPRDMSRDACGPEDPVFGELISLIRYPMKMNWNGELSPTLHDLSWDPWERSDLMATQSETARRLGAELSTFVESRIRNRDEAPSPQLDEATARSLESLGYLD